MAYHYSFTRKAATIREPEIFSEVVKDPQWVKAMNEEMQERDMGSRPPLTTKESDRLQVDL